MIVAMECVNGDKNDKGCVGLVLHRLIKIEQNKKHTSREGSRGAEQALKDLSSVNVCECNNLNKRERFMDKRKVHVLALSEIKLKGRGEFG